MDSTTFPRASGATARRGALAILTLLVVATSLPLMARPAAAAQSPDMCTTWWDGGSGTASWHDPGNWDADELPGPDDVVCIENRMAGTRGVTYSEPVSTRVYALHTDTWFQVTGGELAITQSSGASGLAVDGGRVVVDTWLQASEVHQTAGTVAGAGLLDIAGFLTWSGGAQEGPGRTDVKNRMDGQGGLYMTGTGDRTLAGGRGLEDVAGMRWTDGGFLHLDQASYANLGHSTIASTVAQVKGAGAVRTMGNLFVENSLLSIDGPFYTDTASTIAVTGADGAVALYGGGDLHGDVSLAADTELSLQGGVFAAGTDASIFGQGEVHLAADQVGGTNVSVDGQYQVATTTVSTNAWLHVADAASLGKLSIDEGGLEVKGTVTATELSFDGGDIWGPGTLDVQGNAVWGAGRMAGPGRTEVQGTTSFMVDSATRTLEDRWLTTANLDVFNSGTLAFVGADPQLGVTGDFDVVGRDLQVTGTGKINPGNLTVDGDGSASFGPQVNTGANQIVTVGSVAAKGKLVLGGGGEQHAEFDVAGGSMIHLGGVMSFAADSGLYADASEVRVLPDGEVDFNGDSVLSAFVNQGSTVFAKDASADDIENLGGLQINAARVTVTDRSYHQNGADSYTVLQDQAAVLSAPNGEIHIVDGELSGFGLLHGEVVNEGGEVAPFHHLGIDGTYLQGEGGTLTVDVDGATHGQLDVSGVATIAGTADIEITGAAPTGTYTILSARQVDGTFSHESGAASCTQLWYSGVSVDAEPRPCAVVGTGSAQENAGSITFPVTLTEPSDQDVRIDFGAVSDTATVGDDVSGAAGVLVIPAGQTSGTISVPLVDDDQVEGTETFLLNVSAMGAVLADDQIVGTIVDDDEPPVELPELELHEIPRSIDVGGVQTMNDKFVGGYHGVVIGDEQFAWAYNISTGGSSYIPETRWITDINRHDHAIVECWYEGSCFRKDKANSKLPTLAGFSSAPYALNDSDVIVGALWGTDTKRAAIWADPTATPTFLPDPGGEESWAADINTGGLVVGISRSGTASSGWVYIPALGVEQITSPDFTNLEPKAINDDGTVVGVMWNESRDQSHAFVWYGDQVVDLGTGGANSINTKGDIVGWSGTTGNTGSNVRGALWIQEQRVDLNDLAGQQDYLIYNGVAISDSGAIAAESGSGHGNVPVALTPPGLGCKVCMDFHAEVQQFPNPDVWTTTGNATTEGNTVRLRNTLTNNDGVERTVSVTFFVDDRPYGADEHLVTLAPGESVDVQELWDTEGKAWNGGLAAGPHQLAVTLAYEDGIAMERTTIDMQVNPRPVVMVHGMNSNAQTWADYQSYLTAAHPGWKGFAIDTMDTSSDPPFPIAKNAMQLAAYVDNIQRTQNAWQVDLVGHSMGGLISRLYISELMLERGGVRPVDRLVMLGTPNAGSPCADLFTTSLTWQLRTDVMANFNAMVTDRKGVPFSVAIGDWMPFTCQSGERGDLVVPLSSAAYGIDDTATFDIAHTDMTGSQELFLQFVLPRLNGSQAAVAPQGLTGPSADGESGARSMVAEATADATAAAPPENPQMLMSFTDTIGPGASSEAGFTVPAGTTAMGGVALGDGNVEVQLVRHDRTVAATSGSDPSISSSFRTVAIDQPAAAQWIVRVINHGTTPVRIPVAVWANGLPDHLSATATQVDELGKVHVSATLSGALPDRLPEQMRADLTPSRGGDVLNLTLFDDGQHGDGAAGDQTYGNDATLSPQGWSVMVTTDYGMLMRFTSTVVEVSLGTDDPTVNDAPKAYGSTVAATRNAVTSFQLKGTDPEGSSLTYEIIQGPTHGQLGGGGGGAGFQYAPAKDYMGPDSLTFRVHDGEKYSPPATVTIDVGREDTQLRYIRPIPAESTTGRTIHGVSVQLRDSSLVPMENVPVEFHFAGQTYPSETTFDGFAGVNIDGGVPAGVYDLEVVFPGDATHSPTTLHQNFTIVQGATPVPAIEGPIEAEAEYPANVLVRGNDHDGDSAKFELDVDGDGTWDQVYEQEPASNGVDYGHTFVVTYPEAFDGQVRARVTDAAGNVAEATESVHVAPYRPLGALRRLTDERGQRLDINYNGGVDASGRYVLHEVTHDEVDGAFQALAVLDRTTGTDEIVSVMPDGTVNEHWPVGVISSNGRYVAFRVAVPLGNLLPYEVYLRDRVAGTTIPVSVNSSGDLASWSASAVAVSDDGKVLFVSNAGNLGTIPPNCGTVGQTYSGCQLLWLRDPAAGTTTLVSHDTAGNGIPVESSTNDMTADGRYVVWGDNHIVWLWDATTGQATRQGIGIGGADSNAHDIGASNFQLSEDGSLLLFNSTGTNISPDDTDADLDVYLFDRGTGVSTLVSRATNGEKGNSASYDPVMSGDGRVVAFNSYATNMAEGDDDETWDVFVRDLDTGVTTRVSEEARDHLQADADSFYPVLSCDARWVVFASDAQRLVPGDINQRRDAFVFDRGAAASRPCDGSTPPVNHAPVADDGTATTTEDTAVAVGLTATDEDGDELTYAVTEGPAHGTLTGEGSALTYTPAADFHGTDTVTFTASDAESTSEPATMSITVDPVNDAPSATLVAPATVDEGASTGIDVQATDTDGDPLTYTWSASTGILSGSGTHVALGGVDGPTSVTVTVTVNDGTESVVKTATVEVQNLAPTAGAGADLTVPVGTSVTFTGTAADQGPADTAAGLSASWAFGDGTIATGLTSAHVFTQSGTYQVILTVTDRDGATGQDTATVVVTQPAPQPKPMPKLVISTTNATFGFAATSATLTDPTSGAPLAGRIVTFALNGRTLTATTDATGVARVPAMELKPGSYPVTAGTAADDRYEAATATGALKVTNSIGRVQALVLDQGGLGGLIVNNDGRRMTGVMGWISRFGLTGACNFTGIGISPNKNAAWIAGRTWDGKDFVVYVEDNGGLFSRKDVFRLWVDGVERTGGSTRILGDVTIR